MEGNIPCKDCGFDLSTLPMTLPQSHPSKGAGGRDVEVFCPLCGHPHSNLMKDRGFFLREVRDADGNILSTKWRYWSEAAQQVRSGTQGPRPVPIGALSIQFGEEAEPIRPSEILFQQVFRFMHQSGNEAKPTLPMLPVKPEYLDCLDPEALRRIRLDDEALRARVIQKSGKPMYECTLPLRGLPEKQWKKETLPIGADVEGVFLRHWPNIDDLRWRFHLVSLGFDDAKGRAELSRNWDVQALVPRLIRTTTGTLDEDESTLYPYKLPTPNAKDPGRRVFSTAIEGKDVQPGGPALHQGRPAWMSVSLNGSGGVFALPPGKSLGAVGMEFGLDFGTSNTVIATTYPGEPEAETVAPNQETTRWIFGRIDPREDPDELWPGAAWTGQCLDLLPSELMLRDGTWPQYNGRPDEVSRMKFGVDIGIPLMMAQRGRDLARSVVRPLSLLSDFKWQRALRAQGLEGLAAEAWRVQAKFLEAGLLMAIASRVHARKEYPTSVDVWYSYPPAFQVKDKDQLEMAGGGGKNPKADAVATRLKWLLGLDNPVGFTRGPDEANAAVFSEDPGREFAVFVDIGGGSMEVVVRDEYVKDGKDGHRGLEQVVTSKSLYFGGGVYLRSLIGTRDKGCVMPGLDFAQLASRVRRYGSGSELMEADRLFGPQRVATARLRAQVYGEAIADFVARTLAGMCLEHGYQKGDEGVPEERRRLNLTRNRLFYLNGKKWQLGGSLHGAANDQRQVKFTLFLLGNGWNTVEIAVPAGANQDVESYFAARVRSRLAGLLKQEEATARRITDGAVNLSALKLVIECPQVLKMVKHRKAVVAVQVLKQKANTGGAGGDMRRGVLGLEMLMGSRRIEWYRPFGPPQEGVNIDPARKSRISLSAKRPAEVGPREVLPIQQPDDPPSLPPPPPPSGEWHLATPNREPKGKWAFEAMVEELRRQPDAEDWLVWKKGDLGTWTVVKAIPDLWAKVRPSALWAVALGAKSLGTGLGLEAARAAMLSSGDAEGCKVWCKAFGKQWKMVKDVEEFAAVLPPPLDDDGPPPLDDDGPPPLDTN